MPVTYGYLKNTDNASIGTVVTVPRLKEIGVTCANDHFVVFGTKAEVREWLKAHGSLKVSASGGSSVRVTSREHKQHKSPLEVIGNKLFDLIPNAGNASKVAAVHTYMTDSHPWIMHFELYPKSAKGPESIDVFSHTLLVDVARRLSLVTS
jgi:hypothetical protein